MGGRRGTHDWLASLTLMRRRLSSSSRRALFSVRRRSFISATFCLRGRADMVAAVLETARRRRGNGGGGKGGEERAEHGA